MGWYDSWASEQDQLKRERDRIKEAMNDREIGYDGYSRACEDLEKINRKLDPENR